MSSYATRKRGARKAAAAGRQLDRYGWSVVRRVNAKTVTVDCSWGRIPRDRIVEVHQVAR